MALRFTRLDRLTIRKLQPGLQLAEHGITFERLANGDGRYTVNFMVDGVRIHRVIGKESDGVTRQQAEDFIEKARTDARTGRLNLPRGRKMVLDFAQAAEQYLVRQQEAGAPNLKQKREKLRLRLIPYFKDKPLAAISSFDIEKVWCCPSKP